jgi:hypothetical protein
VVAAPALVGWKLKLFVFLEESSLFGNLIKSNFLKLNHFPQVFFFFFPSNSHSQLMNVHGECKGILVGGGGGGRACVCVSSCTDCMLAVCVVLTGQLSTLSCSLADFAGCCHSRYSHVFA